MLTRYKEPFRGLSLPRHILERIYSANFRRLWGAEPKSVKVDLAISICEEMGDRMTVNLLKTAKTKEMP